MLVRVCKNECTNITRRNKGERRHLTLRMRGREQRQERGHLGLGHKSVAILDLDPARIATGSTASVCVLQCFAVCYSVLQCVAVCCSMLQCVAVCCSVLQCVAVCRSVVQCVAVWYSVLQCGAVWCSVVQCVAVDAMWCSVSQCAAVRCSELQCVAVYCSAL